MFQIIRKIVTVITAFYLLDCNAGIAHDGGDVIAINQCIYDLYVQVDDEKLKTIISPLGINKGGYKKLNTAELKSLLKQIPKINKMHAGSAAANTLAGISSLNGKTTFVGVLADDDFGNAFLKDMKNLNVQTFCPFVKDPKEDGTALVIVLITPDGERTITCYPGVSLPITTAYFDPAIIKNYSVVFSDAYIWDGGKTTELLKKSYEEARFHGITTAFGLGNAGVIKPFQQDILAFLDNIDIVFGNLEEYRSLFKMDSIESIIGELQKRVPIAILTNAEHGALIITPEVVLHSPAKNVDKIVDTTGAGDMYAAGFLYGYTHGFNLEKCSQLGSEFAGTIITQLGARPEKPMPEILEAVL